MYSFFLKLDPISTLELDGSISRKITILKVLNHVHREREREREICIYIYIIHIHVAYVAD